jgi:hypothetical protein
VVNQYSCGGQVPVFKQDGLMVVDENLNSNKDDYFISRSFKLRIEPQSTGTAIHRLQIRYGPFPELQQLTTPYIDWLRVYVPAGSRLLSASGMQAEQSTDLGNAVLQGWLQFGYGESKTLTLTYEVPATVMNSPGAHGSLRWLKQAGREADQAIVEVATGKESQTAVLEQDVSFRLS